MVRKYAKVYCKSCKQILNRNMFGPRLYSGVSTCSLCKEIKSLKTRCKLYKISVNDFLDLYDKQDGKCYACNTERDIKSIHIDHCHSKGHVRGLLCRNCNLALRLIKDNKETLLNLVAYLEENR